MGIAVEEAVKRSQLNAIPYNLEPQQISRAKISPGSLGGKSGTITAGAASSLACPTDSTKISSPIKPCLLESHDDGIHFRLETVDHINLAAFHKCDS